MNDTPYNANDVILDLSEQVKQLSLNNSILRAMITQLQKSAIAPPEEEESE